MKKRLWMPIGFLLLGSLASGQQVNSDLTWMFSYRDKGENALAGDKRLQAVLANNLPTARLPSWGPVNEVAITFLGGVPGDIEVKDQRYVTASGCPAHACVAHAMLWVDTTSKTVFFVATGNEEFNRVKATGHQYPIASAKLYIATNAATAPNALPDELRASIIRWLHVEGVLQLADVTLLTPAGSQPVTTDQLGWTRAPLFNGKPVQ